MNHPSRFIKNNDGFSFIEIVIAIGIAGVIMASLPAMMGVMNKSTISIAANVTKTELITKIRMNSINLFNIESSARLTQTLGDAGMVPNVGTANSNPHSNMMAKCMPNISGISGCDKSTMDDPRGFKFYLAGNNSTNVADAVAGEDIYYNSRGNKCTSAQAANVTDCPIKTSVWAEPFCNGFSTTCSKAISLTVRYKIEVRPEYSGNYLFAPQEGEIYVTLSKGIQLSRVLSQTDNPIQLNSSGIYSVQKYYGHADQGAQPQGLRFEAILGNPTGLVSMRIQYRAITGTDVDSFLDDSIPSDLTNLDWTDVEDPISGAGSAWSVQLTGAKSNQIINFGTQTTATASNNTSKAYRIGATIFDSIELQRKFRWTLNGSNQLVAPTFLSGFYQFRVLATDSTNASIESMNYLTVRIIPRPQFLIPTVQPSYIQNRNCISGQDSNVYSVGLADDESLGDQTLKLNATDSLFTAVTGRSGFITIPFSLSQEIAMPSKNFAYTYTVKNKFTDKSINGAVVPISAGSFGVTLNEKPIIFQPLSSTPSKIRIGTTGAANGAIEMGSCCSEVPTVSWQYPAVPEAAAALLSGNATSTATCTTDNLTNVRMCFTSVPITGIKESPNSTSSPDISSQFSFSTGLNACTGGTATTSYLNNTYIPVVKIPGIQFFMSESLWLNLPSSEIGSLKSFSPTAYVRADFQPDEDVTVGVYQSSDNSLICSITFTAGAGTAAIDRPCAIPANYNGDLTLQRISPNVMIDTDPPGPSFRAKLISGKLNHRTCQPNLQTVPDFANYTLPADQPMLNSPWGFTTDGMGNVIQDTKNDTGLWTSSSVKRYRCYDNWSGTLNGLQSYNNSDHMAITGIGADIDINVQDIYNLHRYNSEIKPIG